MDLAYFPQDLRHAILGRAVPWTFDSGEVPITQGTPAHCLIFLLEGCVQVAYLAEDGSSCVLAHPSAGDIIGDTSLLLRVARTAQVRAITRTRVFLLPCGGYYDLACKFPSLETACAQLLASRLRSETGGPGAARRLADMV
jgi:CRP-like cAMP-binding protein